MVFSLLLLLGLQGKLSAGSIPGNPGSKRDAGVAGVGPLTEVQAVVGGQALLPCDVRPPTHGDAPILVLFYNGATGTPIYSIDARSGPVSRSHHWTALESRAHFDVTSEVQGLVVSNVQAEDDGDYRCRVDFKSSPTRNLRVKLLVIVPPERVSIISNRSGVETSGMIGPYPVGSQLSLTCQVTGGKPRPKVTWLHEGMLLDDVEERKSGEITQNVLTLPNLSRQHLYRVLTCQGQNSNLSAPLAATVTLDLSFPPEEVLIKGSNEPLSEGVSYSLVCEASGSRPAANISWWMDGKLMLDTKEQVLQEGNISRSTVHIVPTRSNDAAIVYCRADNQRLAGHALEDSRKLIVYYSPKLQLRAGQNLDMTNIKEGDDVYFECEIHANPPVIRVHWFHNGEELHQNQTAGVIQSNQSLVLQSVRRSSSGLYTCRAINMQGSATSNAVQLSVKFSPVCSENQKWVYGGGRSQSVNISCRVEAHPEANNFRWAFNTSSEYVKIPQDRIHSSRGRSQVEYTPQTHHDFGSLLCWGVNIVGVQPEPCVFHIVPAAVPEPVHNCSVWHNVTAAGQVVVECEPGWSGGLAQNFSLEVHQGDITADALAALRDQAEPHFTVTGLTPGTEYHLAVVATNTQGSAPPTILVHHTPIDVAEKRTSPTAAESSGSGTMLAITPILSVLVGVVASLVVCTAVLVVVVRMRNNHNRGAPQTQTKIVYDKATPLGKTCDDGGFLQQQEQRGPDIILVKSDGTSPVETKQLVKDYISNPEGSFYIQPGSVINNGSVASRETDALLQERSAVPTSIITSSKGGATVTTCHVAPPPPHVSAPVHAFLATPGTDSLPRSSFCPPIGRGSPSMCSSTGGSIESPQGSASTVVLHPDYYSHEHLAGDSPRVPLVAAGPATSNRESSV